MAHMGFGLGAMQAWLGDARTTFHANMQLLDDLDTAIGDGDHGTNMARGFDAAVTVDFVMNNTPKLALRQIGMQLLGTIGGASGALYGTFFLTLSASWPSELNAATLAHAFGSARDAVQARGRAEIGDKTMVDSLDAAVRSLSAAPSDASTADALSRAADAAKQAAEATRDMLARRGRAALLGERSVGHVDPGAASIALLFEITARQAAFLSANNDAPQTPGDHS